MKLLGIISVGFYVTGQLLIRFSAFVRYWRKSGTTMRLFIGFKNTYDLVRKEVLYNYLMEIGVPMKSVRLIKMCLNETYDRLCGLVVRVLGYRSGCPGSIPGTTKKNSGSGTGSTQPREYN
jgi:hypothetical protein